MRLLCLQGKGGDAAALQQRLLPLAASLGPDAHLATLDAPHQIDHHASTPQRAWWINPPNERSYTADEYTGDDEAIRIVEQAWQNAPLPYDAIFGFSQGAMLAAILCARGYLGEGPVAPKCAILCGAATPRPYESMLQRLKDTDPDLLRYATGAPLWPVPEHVPSLHVLSAADKINPPAMGQWVASCFGEGARTYWHDGGHIIPGDRGDADAECVEAVAAFLRDKLDRSEMEAWRTL